MTEQRIDRFLDSGEVEEGALARSRIIAVQPDADAAFAALTESVELTAIDTGHVDDLRLRGASLQVMRGDECSANAEKAGKPGKNGATQDHKPLPRR